MYIIIMRKFEYKIQSDGQYLIQIFSDCGRKHKKFQKILLANKTRTNDSKQNPKAFFWIYKP